MNLVLPFVQSEYALALDWIRWVKTFCGFQPNYVIHLLPFKGMDYEEAETLAKTVFKDCVVIPDEQGVVSDWKGGKPKRDARGPNSLFRQAAWHFYYAKKGPWFYCEVDCVPVKKDAFDLVLEEYESVSSDKPFLGTVMEATTRLWMNGSAIYPQDVPEQAPNLITMTEYTTGHEVAFDFAGAQQVVPKAHNSSLFQNIYLLEGKNKIPTFPKHKHLLKPETAFFHRCQDGSLMKMLAAEGNGSATEMNRTFPERLARCEEEIEPRKRPRAKVRHRRKRGPMSEATRQKIRDTLKLRREMELAQSDENLN